jgi:flagellin-like protein
MPTVSISAAHRIRSIGTRRSRGVSPIIAMILLVAIVVVLAAVFYALVTGLTHGPNQPSIGTALSLGTPTSGTCWAAGVTAHICGTAGDRLWNLTVQVSSVELGDILIEVHTSHGATYVNPLAGGFCVVRAGSSTPIAYYSIPAGKGLAMTSGFTYSAGYSSTTKVDSTMFLVIGTGTSAANWTPNQGNSVTVLGTNHYSGQTMPTALP